MLVKEWLLTNSRFYDGWHVDSMRKMLIFQKKSYYRITETAVEKLWQAPGEVWVLDARDPNFFGKLGSQLLGVINQQVRNIVEVKLEPGSQTWL